MGIGPRIEFHELPPAALLAFRKQVTFLRYPDAVEVWIEQTHVATWEHKRSQWLTAEAAGTRKT